MLNKIALFAIIMAMACLNSAAWATAVLDVQLTADDYYTITAQEDDLSAQYFQCKVDVATGGIFSFKDLTDAGDGADSHSDYLGASAYGRKCTLLYFDGRGGNVCTVSAALAGISDRISFNVAADGSSFTINYGEDALSESFFNNSYTDGALSLSPGNLLTNISVTITPPGAEGTFWDWSISSENVSDHSLSPKIWAQQIVKSCIEGSIVKTSDYEDSLIDSPFNSSEPVSFMRQTIGDNAALGLTAGREFIVDYQYGLSGHSNGMDVSESTWAGFTILNCVSPFSYDGSAALPAGETRYEAGQYIINIAAECIGCPIADAGADQQITAALPEDQMVTLDAAASSDPDGNIVSYVWTEQGNQIATGVNPQIMLSLGAHYIDLTVTDADGNTDTDTVVVEITLQGANRVFYIDYDNGDDTNHGRSPAAAWKHSPGDSRAAGTASGTALSGGDMLIFAGGVHYRGQIDFAYSGEAGNHIVLDGNSVDSFGTGAAILDGSKLFSGWTQCSSPAEAGGNVNYQNIWYAPLPSGVEIFTENMYQGDELLSMAQDPNIADPQYYDDLESFISIADENISDTQLTDTGYFTQADPNAWDGAYVHIWINPNIVVSKLINSYDPATSTIFYNNVGGGGTYTERDSLYAVANSFLCLDTPGEYVIDEAAGMVYLWPLDSADPNTVDISASVYNYGFDFRGSSHVTFRDFKVMRYSSPIGASRQGSGIRNYADNTDDLLISGNEVTQNRSMEKYGGIYLTGVNNSLITDNYVHHNVRNRGIMCTGDNNEVSHNLLDSNGGTGIYTPSSTNSRILYNTVLNHTGVHANGITLYLGCYNCEVKYNTVLGGLCALTTQDANTIHIAYNLLSRVGEGYTVADWSGGTHTSLNLHYYNNTIMQPMNETAVSFGSQSRTGLIFQNNILDGAGDLSAEAGASNNIYTTLSWSQDENNLEPNSVYIPDKSQIFADAANGDYHLAENSPAIDAGVATTETVDIEGNAVPQGAAPDLGAYEYQSQNLTPGDADGNGSVNIFDFLILKDHYGMTSGATWADGDFDGNGAVNIFDFLILKAHYGQ